MAGTWYIDPTATGLNDGSSWQDAFSTDAAMRSGIYNESGAVVLYARGGSLALSWNYNGLGSADISLICPVNERASNRFIKPNNLNIGSGQVNSLRYEGIEFTGASVGNDYATAGRTFIGCEFINSTVYANGNTLLQACILRDKTANYTEAIEAEDGLGHTEHLIYNCLFDNNRRCLVDAFGADPNTKIRNSIFTNSSQAHFYSITNAPDSDYNIFDNTEGTGTNDLNSRTLTDNKSPGAGDWVIVEDIAGNDYGLYDSADNDARGAGVNLGTTYNEDYEGNTHPGAGAWDIGPYVIGSSTAPVLSNPQETSITDTTATLTCESDTAGGTVYSWTGTTATRPSRADIIAGTGATYSQNTVGVSGTNTHNATGLTAGTTYYTYWLQVEGGEDSNDLDSGSWATTGGSTAVLCGKWTGGAVAIIPTTTWAAPNGMFPTEIINDTSAYSWNSATSTLTLPATDLPDAVIVDAKFEFEDTSNGRHNPQARFIQTVGTGVFGSASTSGYNRDNSEDRSYCDTMCMLKNPSASAQIQFQWRRDTDAPTGGTVRATIQVTYIYGSAIAIFTSTSNTCPGGTTPTQITGFSGADDGNITLSGDTVTLAGTNKQYLCFGSYYWQGIGNARTQRWGGFRVDGTFDDGSKGYAYGRNGANADIGEMFSRPIVTTATSRTVDLAAYRGDGVANLQGGADVDGNATGSNASHMIAVIELHDNAEIFFSEADANSPQLATTGPVDLNVFPVAEFVGDVAAFSRQSDTQVRALKDMKLLLGANVSAASNNVGTGQRWTAFTEFTVNGSELTDQFAGDYMRNNQGSQDTFGWSGNLVSIVSVVTNDDIGVSVTELPGSEGGGGNVLSPASWTFAWGVNLDSTPLAGGPTVIETVGTASALATTSGISGADKEVDFSSSGQATVAGVAGLRFCVDAFASASAAVAGVTGVVISADAFASATSSAAAISGSIKSTEFDADGTSAVAGVSEFTQTIEADAFAAGQATSNVGACSIAETVFNAAGVATVAGVTSQTADTEFDVTGFAAVIGVAEIPVAVEFDANGVAAVSVDACAAIAVDAAAAGSATVNGEACAITCADAAAAGSSVATADSAGVRCADAAAAGVATTGAISAGIRETVFNADGLAVVAGVGEDAQDPTQEATGSSAGVAVVAGGACAFALVEGDCSAAAAIDIDGCAVSTADFTEAGIATAAAGACTVSAAVGNAAGSATVSGDAMAASVADANADGQATVDVDTCAIICSTGFSSASATVVGQTDSSGFSETVGTAAGVATVSGVSSATANSDGNAICAATVDAESCAINNTEGNAAGAATVDGQSAVILCADGVCAAASVGAGDTTFTMASTGNAAGVAVGSFDTAIRFASIAMAPGTSVGIGNTAAIATLLWDVDGIALTNWQIEDAAEPDFITSVTLTACFDALRPLTGSMSTVVVLQGSAPRAEPLEGSSDATKPLNAGYNPTRDLTGGA